MCAGYNSISRLVSHKAKPPFGIGTTAVDTSGNGWNGTLVNGPIRAAGVSGNSVDLDGANDYVNLPAGIVSGLTEITVSAWVRLDAISNWARLFDFGSGTNTNMFFAPRSGITSRPVFAITTSGAGGEQRINSGSVTIATNTWTHVAVTIGGGTGIMYINGAEVGRNNSMTLTPAALGATTQNYIGRSQYSADPYLNGRVDDFRIYDEALNAGEIAELAAVSLVATIEDAELWQAALLRDNSADVRGIALKLVILENSCFTRQMANVECEIAWWEHGDNLPRISSEEMGLMYRAAPDLDIFFPKYLYRGSASVSEIKDLAIEDFGEFPHANRGL